MKKSRENNLKETKSSNNFQRAIEILKDKEKLLTNVMISMGDGVSIQDLDMRIVFQNKFMIDHFGKQTGKYCHKIYEKRDKICVGCPIQKAYKDGKTHKALRVGQTAEGPFRFENIASVLKNEDGEIVAGIELCRIVEDREKALEALRESEKRFQDVALSSADWIWEIDKNGKYIFTSGKVKEIVGYSAEELIGKTPFELMPKEEAIRVRKIFKRLIAEKKPIVNLENWNLSKNKTKILLLTNGVPILSEKGAFLGYRGIDKDITEIKKSEEELKRKNEELEKRDKQLIRINCDLEEANAKLTELDKEKDEFISIAAHELKTPLTSIKGFAQLVKNDKLSKKGSNRYIELISKNSDRLYNLILDLVDSSGISLGKISMREELVDPQKILKDIKENMEKQIKENGLKPIFSIEKGLPKIQADHERLLQVLRNLITNAIHFTVKGSITTKIYKKGNIVQFEVGDTGKGIPKDAQDKIFSRFYQVDSSMRRKVHGSGLGLSICKGLVELMKGKIWFKSKVDKGTTFYFTLPIYKGGEKNG